MKEINESSYILLKWSKLKNTIEKPYIQGRNTCQRDTQLNSFPVRTRNQNIQLKTGKKTLEDSIEFILCWPFLLNMGLALKYGLYTQ